MLLERAVAAGAGERGRLGHAVDACTARSTRFGFNVRPDSLERRSAAAQRAVDAAPSSHLAHYRPGRRLTILPQGDCRRSGTQRSEPSPLTRWTERRSAFIGHLWRSRATGSAAARWSRTGHGAQPPSSRSGTGLAAFFDAYRRGDYRGAVDVRPQDATCRATSCDHAVMRRRSTGSSVSASRLRRPCEDLLALRARFRRDRAR